METRSNIRDYEKLREACIDSFKYVYKDSIAFDMNECSKEERTLLLQDPQYISATKAAKALMFAKDLKVYQGVIDGEYGDPEKDLSPSDVMKAVEMRRKILFNDLNIDADESNQINIITTYLSKEDMEKMEIVTSFSEGKANAQMDNSLLMPDGTAFKNEEEKEKEKENKGTVTE